MPAHRSQGIFYLISKHTFCTFEFFQATHTLIAGTIEFAQEMRYFSTQSLPIITFIQFDGNY